MRPELPVALLACVLLAGCGSASSTTRDSLLPLKVPASVTIGTTRVDALGTVLADGQGHVLYMFPPDAASRVSCTGACAGTWPPVTITLGHKAKAGSGIDAAQLSTVADPNSGADVVTYAGYPLYTYAGDVGPHTANGQALFNNGGPWYVLSPSGEPITVDPDDAP